MIALDEIRWSVSLSPMFFGETRRGPMVAAPPATGGPFYFSSVVVNRSPLHAGKERNAPSAGQGASSLVHSTGVLLSSATSRTRRDRLGRIALKWRIRREKEGRGMPIFRFLEVV
jgi:hypothetical protein